MNRHELALSNARDRLAGLRLHWPDDDSDPAYSVGAGLCRAIERDIALLDAIGRKYAEDYRSGLEWMLNPLYDEYAPQS